MVPENSAQAQGINADVQVAVLDLQNIMDVERIMNDIAVLRCVIHNMSAAATPPPARFKEDFAGALITHKDMVQKMLKLTAVLIQHQFQCALETRQASIALQKLVAETEDWETSEAAVDLRAKLQTEIARLTFLEKRGELLSRVVERLENICVKSSFAVPQHPREPSPEENEIVITLPWPDGEEKEYRLRVPTSRAQYLKDRAEREAEFKKDRERVAKAEGTTDKGFPSRSDVGGIKTKTDTEAEITNIHKRLHKFFKAISWRTGQSIGIFESVTPDPVAGGPQNAAGQQRGRRLARAPKVFTPQVLRPQVLRPAIRVTPKRDAATQTENTSISSTQT